MKAKVLYTFLLVAVAMLPALAQQPDSLIQLTPPGVDPSDGRPDFSNPDYSYNTDTVAPRFSGIRLSKDSLDAPVAYSSQDSMIYDISGQQIHLYGAAEVKYQTISLKAAHIVFDWNTNIVTATGMPDSLGRRSGIPEFADGDQQFTADSMRYNFDTRKGVVYDVRTEYTDIVVRGSKAKFVSAKPSADTSLKGNDIIYNQDAIFTTCTHPEPHFGIRSKKQKVVPDKLVVVGPSNLEIMGIPTPLWLPFGFFPISKGRSTGLLFPRDYEYSPQWGFGLRDIGWFFPLGEHFNLSLKSNIYLKGTWGLGAETQYAKRYKYSGSASIAYDVRRSEDNEGNISRPKSFAIRWTHNQAATAHPSSRFGGSINFQTNGYQSRVYNDAENVLQSQLSSNFSYSKNWTDKPISLSVAFNHSQNTRSKEVTVNFPTIDFQTRTVYPFRSNKGGGSRRPWYEDINVRYKMQAKSTFRGVDTSFFSQQTLDNAQYGMQQDVSTGTSFKILKYFSLNPNVSYREVWYFRTLRREFLEGVGFDADTTINPVTGEQEIRVNRYGTVVDTMLTGFEAYRTLSSSIGLNTQIFGTLRLGNGWLRGLRHVVKPTISVGYQPDYLNNPNYYDLVRDPFSSPDDPLFDQYSIFERGIYGRPPATEQQLALSYSINNIFEAKIFSKRDSTERKVKLFDNIYINGQYNFAADSLKWSPVNISGTTRFFKGITTVSARAIFDPYVQEMDDRGNFRRVDKLAWRQRGRFLDFNSAQANFTTRVTVSKLRALFQGEEEEVIEDMEAEFEQRRNRRREETDFLSLFENFSINHNISFNLGRIYRSNTDFRDTFTVKTHSIDVRGAIDLTEKWRIGVSRIGYDFIRKQLTYPSLSFSRDLHCWEMSMNWAPTRGTYSFSIRVKPGTLDFLKFPYDRNNADAIRAFQ